MTKRKRALLDTDFISKLHITQKDDENRLIDRILELPGYQFVGHGKEWKFKNAEPCHLIRFRVFTSLKGPLFHNHIRPRLRQPEIFAEGKGFPPDPLYGGRKFDGLQAVAAEKGPFRNLLHPLGDQNLPQSGTVFKCPASDKPKT